MQVLKGKKNIKPFRFIKISPGSFPNQGIFLKNKKNIPKITKIEPIIRKNLAI
jgi:hypothetical protein